MRQAPGMGPLEPIRSSQSAVQARADSSAGVSLPHACSANVAALRMDIAPIASSAT